LRRSPVLPGGGRCLRHGTCLPLFCLLLRIFSAV
jgi:hypothetical protein